MKKLICIVLIMVTSFSLFATTAPFGLDWGMTEYEIREKCLEVSKTPVESRWGDYVEMEVIPPLSRTDFEDVTCYLGWKTLGLNAISARFIADSDWVSSGVGQTWKKNLIDALSALYGKYTVEKREIFLRTDTNYSWHTQNMDIVLTHRQTFNYSTNELENTIFFLDYDLTEYGMKKYCKPYNYGL